ncbi:MAG TPA: peroxidase-related enzyme [Kofleriaceae bacterium]|nr:peroxidase-related enzyme [Kofleriaceae bacterium]
MAFIRTIPVAEATGEVRALYEQNREPSGLVPNFVKAFSLRPTVWNNYVQLVRSIRGNLDLRRYELVTTATALALESSYCALAHGKALRDRVLGAEQTEAFARDFRQAELTPAETIMVAFVQKMALRPSSITQADVDELRSHGFSDEEIFDIVSVSSVRGFFSKVLDAVGAEPDSIYLDMEQGLRQALTVGRAIETSPAK